MSSPSRPWGAFRAASFTGKPLRIKDPGRPAAAALLLLLLLFLAFALLIPLLCLLAKSLCNAQGAFVGLDAFRTCFREPGLTEALGNTLLMGLAATAVTLPPAFILAYGITRTRMLGATLASGLSLLPLFAPSLFPALGLIYLFGRQGLARPFMGDIDLYGPLGIIMGSAVICLPHATLLLTAGLRSADPSLHEAARTLSAGSFRRFLTITLPQTRYGLISAALTCFILTITDFGVPQVLGGNHAMLATEIYKQVLGQQNFSLGAAISILLLFPALIAFGIDRRARKKQALLHASGMALPLRSRPGRDLAFTLLVWLILGFLLFLFGLVVWGSFISFWPYDFSLTLANYDFSLLGGDYSPLGNSLLLAGSAALLGPTLAFSGAYLSRRRGLPSFLGAAYTLLALIPLSIPGTVLGLAYIFAFNRPGALFACLYGSLPLLLINTLIHFYTVGQLAAVTTLQHINPDFETVGRTLAVPRRRTLFRVILPLSRESLLEISFYFFVNSLTTISALVFLYTPESMPASIFMLQISDTGNAAAASAVGSCILALALAGRLGYSLLRRGFARTRPPQ